MDDLPELAGTTALRARPVATCRRHGSPALDLEAVRAAPGVRAVLTAADIPGLNDCGAVVHDDPILAAGEVHYLGQPVFAVVADTREQARHAARHAAARLRTAARRARSAGSRRQQSLVLPPLKLACGDAGAALADAPLQLAGRARVGGQEHFYLEGQIAYAWPTEDGDLHLHSSTQHPTEMQHAVATMLGVTSNRVRGRGAAHGRRLRRQGVAVSACSPASRRWPHTGCSAR